MIWLTIIGAIVAQAIVVVLIMEYIDRRGKSNSDTAASQQIVETSATGIDAHLQPDVQDAEKIEPKVETAKQSVDDGAVGKSTFTPEMFKAMLAEVVKPLFKECIEEAMDLRDIEFDKSAKEEQPKSDMSKDDRRMTAEQESRAFEDLRDMEEMLDKENNDPVPANPLASGADFEQITAATDTLEHPENHTVQEITVAVKVIHGLNGTEFTGCLPDSLFEQLQHYHQMADKTRSEAEQKAEVEQKAEEVKEVSKPEEKRAEKEKDSNEQSQDNSLSDLEKAMELMKELRQSSQKFRKQ